jgi:hypothetical protein
MAVVWLTVLLAVGAGARWSRAAAGAAIIAQCVIGISEAAGYGDPLEPLFALRFFAPMCLPLLPLVALPATPPRRALALCARGRWREALAQVGGTSSLLVAIALLSLNHGAYESLLALERGGTKSALLALETPATLFALAAVSVRLASGRKPAAPTL